MIGFFVVLWEVGVLTKYVVIALFSLVVTLLLFDIGVKRTRLTRVLFGLRLAKPQT